MSELVLDTLRALSGDLRILVSGDDKPRPVAGHDGMCAVCHKGGNVGLTSVGQLNGSSNRQSQYSLDEHLNGQIYPPLIRINKSDRSVWAEMVPQ